MQRPVTNTDLERLLATASCTNGGFGRAVNAALNGATCYDRSSVYHWLRGRTPDAAVLTAMATVLSRRLGRRVGEHELGFSADAPALDLALVFAPGLPDGIDAAGQLWRYCLNHHDPQAGLARRDVLGSIAYLAGAAPAAAFAWHFTPDDHIPDHGPATGAVTPLDVEDLRQARMQFLGIDRRQGGGSARQWVGDYLGQHVAPLLRRPVPAAVARDLYGAAAQLTEQCGYMHYDAASHGIAQRLFIQALRLAKAAGDRVLSAHVMSNLSVQAVYLGRGAEAVQLARAARTAAGTTPPPALLARLNDTEARGHALLLDERESRAALARAADHLTRAEPAQGPDWLTAYTPAHHAGTAMHVLRDLGHPTEAARHARAALPTGTGGVRSNALHRILHASVLLRMKETDQACVVAADVVGSSGAVESDRLRTRIGQFRAEAAAHEPTTATRDFLELTRPMPR